MFRHTKPLADLLTVGRALLGLCIAGLGGLRGGAEDLPLAVGAVIVSWLTDLLDGPLARRDPDLHTNWIGEHDAEADLTVSLGVAAYLVLSGYMVAWLGALVVLVVLALWIFHSHQLAWPFYALPYLILVIVAFRDAPLFAWLAVGYLAVTLVVHWERLWHESLPEFFQAVNSLYGGQRREASGVGNGDL
ncbi:MAG: hypothetical protein PVH62_04935 [Anaerolineae bacterium]|jgi:hypothetical protein